MQFGAGGLAFGTAAMFVVFASRRGEPSRLELPFYLGNIAIAVCLLAALSLLLFSKQSPPLASRRPV
jgi:hypothetical protein